VLARSGGARTLKVCFNTPSSETQPTIAADGNGANVTYGCTESSPLAPLPGSTGGAAERFSHAVILPGTKACVRRRTLKIGLHNPTYDPLKEVVIRVNGRRVADVRGIKRLKRGVTLKKLPNGTYRVSVLAITVLNQRLSGSSTYRSCKNGLRRRDARQHLTTTAEFDGDRAARAGRLGVRELAFPYRAAAKLRVVAAATLQDGRNPTRPTVSGTPKTPADRHAAQLDARLRLHVEALVRSAPSWDVDRGAS
jgi:hypothetical protein